MHSSPLPSYGGVRYCPAGHWQPRPSAHPLGNAEPLSAYRVRSGTRKLELNGQFTEWPADQLFVRRCTKVVRVEDPNTGRAVSILCGQEWVESTHGSTHFWAGQLRRVLHKRAGRRRPVHRRLSIGSPTRTDR